jgi:hypothetical protein
MIDDIGWYILANTAWVVVLALTMSAAERHPIAFSLAVAQVPVAAGIGRMSARSVRGERATARDFLDGLTHRASATWAVGVIVLAVVAVAGVNVTVAAEGGGRLLALSAVVTVHLVAVVLAALAAAWPLLMDPARDGRSSRALLRQSLVVLAVRPWTMAAVVLLAGLLVVAQVTVLATAFVLPSVMQLVTGHVVVPWADRIDAPRGST